MPISEKQLLANRNNAQKSTGPKTASGKSISSKNSLTHGLRSQRIVIEGEDQQEFDDFRDLLTDWLSPDGPLEMLLVDRIAASSWRLRRAGHIEAQIFDQMRKSLAAVRNPNPNDFFVQAHINDDMGFPGHSRFSSFQEAGSAPDAAEDGIACTRDRLLDDRPGDILDAISNMKKKCQNRPDILSKLSELQGTFEIIARHSNAVHVPSLRQYLQDLRPLIHASPNLTDKYASDLDDAIKDLSYLEMDINRRLQPNLGQALCHDLKGPDVLTKFIRYESQIQRGLFKATHELQRLQAIRRGRQTTAPVAIDVDISGDCPP